MKVGTIKFDPLCIRLYNGQKMFNLGLRAFFTEFTEVIGSINKQRR